MSVVLDSGAARHRFEQAAVLARDKAFTSPWEAYVTSLALGPQRTFVAFLATALLAKATNRAVDAFAIKPDASAGGYSARTFCSRILVPLARQHGVDLGATGDDPLANQPFFRYSRLDPDIKVKSPTQYAELRRLLVRASELSENDAVRALAALLRVRSAARATQQKFEMRAPLSAVLAAAAQFVTEDSEGGRRGQALVAAALDTVFRSVKTYRVNDPSRKVAGDVHVANGTTTHAYEVRQKATPAGQVLAFASRLSAGGIHRGAVVLLSPNQPRLEDEELRSRALNDHGLQLEIFYGVERFLGQVFAWSPLPLENAVSAFVSRMSVRLEEIGVKAESLKRWNSLFQ